MARSLADMIDDDTMEDMASSAGQKGTNGHQIAGMYGIGRPDGPESLRSRLRSEFAEPGQGMIKTHVEGYEIDSQVDRILRMHGIDPVHLVAAAIWAGGPIEIGINERLTLSAHASWTLTQFSTSLRLGKNHEAVWEFPDDEGNSGNIEIFDHPLPETVLSALTGKPVETVFTHPASDGAGLIIVEALHYSANNSTYLKLAKA